MHEKPQTEKTLVIIKPDGVQRSLIGEVIKRYERVGLKMVALKMLVATPELIEKHYTVDPDWFEKVGNKQIQSGATTKTDPVEIGKDVLGYLTKYFISGPMIAMIWQGAHAVDVVRKITGGTEPRTSDVGTIRGDFMLDSYELSNKDKRSVRNIVHASGSVDEAQKEIALWFNNEEIINYKLIQERILYDVNLDGTLE